MRRMGVYDADFQLRYVKYVFLAERNAAKRARRAR